MRQLVVIAGGLGTRLSNSGVRTPKILLKVASKTLLERYIELAQEDSYDELLLLLGHQNLEIESFLKGEIFPINVRTFTEPSQLGTAGALIQAKHLLADEFTLILGDLLVKNANLKGTYEYFISTKIDVLAFSKYTDHPEDSDLISVSRSGEIDKIRIYPHSHLPKIPTSLAGIAHIRKRVITTLVPDEKLDFFKSVLPDLIEKQYSVHCIYHQGLVRDIGTPSRLSNADSYFQNANEFKAESKALLLDRDGTLIRDIPYNIVLENVELLEHAVPLLQSALNKFQFIGVITNQPLIARGEGNIDHVNAINLRMQELIGLGDPIRCFYVCPHHPDSGFEGEVSSLKRLCQCRKPEVELLLKAGIDGAFYLTNALFIGDSDVDIYAAKKVGASWIHLHNNSNDELLSCNLMTLPHGKCVYANELEKEAGFWCDHFKSSS